MDAEYAHEVTQDIRNEVLVHGAEEVARALEVDERCIREIAPEEARRWDKVKGNR